MTDINTSCQGFDFFRIPFGCIDAIVVVGSLSIFYQFITRYFSTKDEFSTKPKKVLFYLGSIFSVFIICDQILMFLIAVLRGCKDENDFEAHEAALDPLWGFFYIFQSYLLSLISFITLVYSFNDTPFEVSKCTVILYKIMFIFIPILGLIAIALSRTTIAAILLVLEVFIMVIVFVSIITLFIRRLIAVYKHIDSDSNLIRKITKLTVLTGISIGFTLLVPILIICVLATDPLHAIGSAGLFYLVLIDTTTNLWCIVMTFGYFNNYYIKLCSPMHSKCLYLWARCLGQETKLMQIIKDNTKDNTNTSRPTMELSIDETATQTQTPTATQTQASKSNEKTITKTDETKSERSVNV